MELLLRKLAESATPAELVQMYPQLSDEDVRAAAQYAADAVAHEETILVNDASTTRG